MDGGLGATIKRASCCLAVAVLTTIVCVGASTTSDLSAPKPKRAAKAPKVAKHPPLGPSLQSHRDAGYLDCPLAKLSNSKAWACWRSDPARAERLLGWAWHPGEGRWRKGAAPGSASTFDAAAFARAHANTTIAFVGDSVVRQQFVSLACLLWREAGLAQRHYRADPRTVVSARYGLTLSFSTSKFLVAKRAGRLALDEVDSSLKAALALAPQVLIVSASHWYEPQLLNVSSDAAVLEHYRAALRRIRADLRRAANSAGRTRVIVRTVPQRHFIGGRWDTGGQCELPAPLLDSDARWRSDASLAYGASTARDMSAALADVLGSGPHGFELLDVGAATRARADAHVGRFRCPRCRRVCEQDPRRAAGAIRCAEWIYDCSHYCLPGVPDVWNAQLQALLSAPRRRLAPAPVQPQLPRSGRQRKGQYTHKEQRRGGDNQRLCFDTAWTWEEDRNAPSAAAGGEAGEAREAASCPVPYRRSLDDQRPGRTESLCCPRRAGAAASVPPPRLRTCDGATRLLDELTPWLRNRRVALVGDSLMNHLFVEWGRRLGARRVGTHRATTSLHQSLLDWCSADVARAPEGTLHSVAHNVTLLKHSMHLRDVSRCNASRDGTRRWLGGGGAPAGKDVDLSRLDAALGSADVVIVNVGVHWRAGSQRHYRRAVHEVLRTVAAANRRGR